MIRILFDNTEIDGNYILSLTQTAQPFNQVFSIGNTICRQFTVDIKNIGFNSIPDKVYLYEDNDSNAQSDWTKYATLLVDDFEDKNDNYTTFSLTDVMVRFNTRLDYLEGDTAMDVIDSICQKYSISHLFNSFYKDDFVLTWQDGLLERDFISFVAEINGSYAYINADGDLDMAQYTNTSVHTIDANYCSSYKIGAKHQIGRVYIELGTATAYYPQTSQYDTLYLNSSNIFFDTETAQEILQHIYSLVNGLTFYNIQIEKCLVNPNVLAGQMMQLKVDSDYYNFVAIIDYSYNERWNGGYSFDLDCKVQEETQITFASDLNNRINISVNRETGEITQQINELNGSIQENTSLIQQTANSLSLRVANAENGISSNSTRLTQFETAVSINSTGVSISQGTEGNYTRFTDSGMDIYVESNKVAWATSDGFGSEELIIGGFNDTDKWHMHMSNNGNTLTFIRRG